MKNKDNAIRYSFVIPAYNYAGYIACAIDSVLEQSVSRNDVEVVVIDDGSTDGTWDVLIVKANLDKRLRVFRQENQGPSAARNAGGAKARGKFLWFLDADDRLAEGAVCAMDLALDEFDDADMVFGGYQPFQDDIKKKPKIPHRGVRLRDEIFKKTIFSDAKGLCVGSSVIRKELFQAIRFPLGVHNGEDAVMYSLLVAIGRVYSVDKIMVFTRRHGESLRGNIDMNIKSGYAAASILFENDLLPASLKKYENPFLAYRFLEMSRLYYHQDMYSEAIKAYLEAIKIYFPSILKVSYMRKFLKAAAKK
ncbi:glycosyltransferase family 2 protein [uncultured Alcanivorax sp.]|jgi:glycosyltransferase involved in cell wall biosynthesis|uniref:glycosyltransferase family 2 protein n=1 Tax=uncultured Alcanivorax sp. TaxID=191215 RepID=UPI00258A7A62|nr:glycosyltransferase family 2 protein [uncultured Alcanivorax sp.]